MDKTLFLNTSQIKPAMDEMAMWIARAEIKKFRDMSSKAPIDEDDVAFMYLVGYAAASGNDGIEVKKAAMFVVHHFMRLGKDISERHMRVCDQDKIRFSFE